MVDTDASTGMQTGEVADDQLAQLPAERLAQMLRDKRKAEANVRARLRDVEGERDKLSGVVTGFQRSALNDLATEAGVAPTALTDLDAHLQLDQILGDDGTLDAAKTSAALSSLRSERPHLFTQSGAAIASSAESFTGSQTDFQHAATWGDVIGG
ncbi:hypothetical protein [Cryobacterium sp. Y50]|uniref:hypothetical protein n=1 Tax=Cryobacterium sp. Y50 TaxID=2048286 RepID=UPI000CE39F18|nr:hypothetical protein [Cryobacterium sp. Y50]